MNGSLLHEFYLLISQRVPDSNPGNVNCSSPSSASEPGGALISLTIRLFIRFYLTLSFSIFTHSSSSNPLQNFSVIFFYYLPRFLSPCILHTRRVRHSNPGCYFFLPLWHHNQRWALAFLTIRVHSFLFNAFFQHYVTPIVFKSSSAFCIHIFFFISLTLLLHRFYLCNTNSESEIRIPVI